MSHSGQKLSRYFRQIKREESGAAMVLALIIICFGALLITPTLKYAATGMQFAAAHDKSAKETYAADAGVEYAIYQMKYDQVSPYPRSYTLADVNGYSVNITLARVTHEIFKTTSSAGGTTIVAHTCPPNCTYFAGDQNLDQDTIIYGNAYIDGNGSIGQNSQVLGDLYVIGDLWLNQCNNVTGCVYATGNVQIDRLPGTTIEIGGFVFSGGNLTIDRFVTVHDDIWAVENIDLAQDVVIEGDVNVGGTVTYNPTKTDIWGVITENYTGSWPPPPFFVNNRHKIIGYKIN